MWATHVIPAAWRNRLAWSNAAFCRTGEKTMGPRGFGTGLCSKLSDFHQPSAHHSARKPQKDDVVQSAGPHMLRNASFVPLDCPTPPLSPAFERTSASAATHKSTQVQNPTTPAGGNADTYWLGGDTSGMRTPRASAHEAVQYDAAPGPIHVNAVHQALLAPVPAAAALAPASCLTPAPAGMQAFVSLSAALKSGELEELETTMQQLGRINTLWALRYGDFALLRDAASKPDWFVALKALLARLPDTDVRALMRTQSCGMLNAAQAANEPEYANALIWAFGDGQTQYISER
jgi:hypothetical protein